MRVETALGCSLGLILLPGDGGRAQVLHVLILDFIVAEPPSPSGLPRGPCLTGAMVGSKV